MEQQTVGPKSESVSAHITALCNEISADRRRLETTFKIMREDQAFVRGLQWPGQSDLRDTRYVANLVRRQINLRVASLYAKNPTLVASRQQRMDFAMWDEKLQSLMAVQERIMQSGMVTPEDAMLVRDIQQGMQLRSSIARMGKTLEIFMTNQVAELTPSFKLLAKTFIRRMLTTGVAYWELGFQSQNGYFEERASKIMDMRQQIARAQQLAADIRRESLDASAAEYEDLEETLKQLEANPDQVLSQGFTHDLPGVFDVIPDRFTTSLKGWIGTRRLARQRFMLKADILQQFGVDLKDSYVPYKSGSSIADPAYRPGVPLDIMGAGANDFVCTYRVFDKPAGTVYTICEGYGDYLVPPSAPEVAVPQFFPIYALTVNDDDHETELFPVSDARIMRHSQMEYNRKRQAQRQHRHANRPLYVSPDGALDEEELKDMENVPAHAIIKLSQLSPGQNARELLQPVEKTPVDPNLYEVSSDMDDILRSTGAQEANLGPTSGATATESSIAETSRASTQNLAADDFEDWLSNLFRDMSYVAFDKFDPEYVKSKVGPGALWPLSRQDDLAARLHMKIEAGSAGRPNADQRAARLERLAPYLIQIPGMNPEWLGKQMIQVVDDRVDITEAFLYGVPSIMAVNGQQQVGTGDPATDPNAQAPQGQLNAPMDGGNGGTSQPEYTTPQAA